jgi:NitT/TauT family transport system ATP-binding protein
MSTAELASTALASAEAVQSGVVFRGVSKKYGEPGRSKFALRNVDLVVERGRFVTLIGPSGCGKSTLLRIAAGLVDADSGDVSIFGQSVTSATAAKQVGFVSQSPALLPWRSVLDNVRLPLQVNRRADVTSRKLRAPEEILAMVGLGDVLEKRPAQLSGGMQQRVSIARAFAFDPEVLLMDEPFSALDEFTREVMRFELLRLWSTDYKTVLFVTHSVAEAVLLSDLVVVMSASPGEIRSVIPVELPRPREEFIDLTTEFRKLERQVRMDLKRGWRHGAN